MTPTEIYLDNKIDKLGGGIEKNIRSKRRFTMSKKQINIPSIKWSNTNVKEICTIVGYSDKYEEIYYMIWLDEDSSTGNLCNIYAYSLNTDNIRTIGKIYVSTTTSKTNVSYPILSLINDNATYSSPLMFTANIGSGNAVNVFRMNNTYYISGRFVTNTNSSPVSSIYRLTTNGVPVAVVTNTSYELYDRKFSISYNDDQEVIFSYAEPWNTYYNIALCFNGSTLTVISNVRANYYVLGYGIPYAHYKFSVIKNNDIYYRVFIGGRSSTSSDTEFENNIFVADVSKETYLKTLYVHPHTYATIAYIDGAKHFTIKNGIVYLFDNARLLIGDLFDDEVYSAAVCEIENILDYVDLGKRTSLCIIGDNLYFANEAALVKNTTTTANTFTFTWYTIKEVI